MDNQDQACDRGSAQGSQESDLTSPKAKGERLRRIRHLANLSREEFCADDEINLTTLISWEIGRFGGLSLKGAKRVIARVVKEGVFCTPEWLLYEIGVGPEVKVDYKKANQMIQEAAISIDRIDESEAIIEELMLFRQLNEQSIDCIIEDDTMLPHYEIGDYVAGTKRYGDKIKNLIGLDCITQIRDGRLVVRNIQAGPRAHSYHLVATHLHTKTKGAIINDVELASAAPIIWHRRKEPISF